MMGSTGPKWGRAPMIGACVTHPLPPQIRAAASSLAYREAGPVRARRRIHHGERDRVGAGTIARPEGPATARPPERPARVPRGDAHAVDRPAGMTCSAPDDGEPPAPRR